MISDVDNILNYCFCKCNEIKPKLLDKTYTNKDIIQYNTYLDVCSYIFKEIKKEE